MKTTPKSELVVGRNWGLISNGDELLTNSPGTALFDTNISWNYQPATYTSAALVTN